MPQRPQSVLFACDWNAVRSPMAEGLLKRLHGRSVFVQSAGVRSGMALDGFAIAACAEVGIDISRHVPRSFEQMEAYGEDFGAYDLIIALSPAANRHALEYTRTNALTVEYWPTIDPTAAEGSREERLAFYRQCRDQLWERIRKKFPPAPIGSD